MFCLWPLTWPYMLFIVTWHNNRQVNDPLGMQFTGIHYSISYKHAMYNVHVHVGV